MSLHPLLLDLQRESSGVDSHSHRPFILSLRDRQEFSFSNRHSFGLYKVPHIGVYGSEYTLCSSLVLLSLPAVPRLLHALPFDLVSALDLTSYLRREGINSQHGGLSFSSSTSSSSSDRELRVLAQVLVQRALEAACRRASKEMASAPCSMDTQNTTALSQTCESYSIPTITVTTESSAMDVGATATPPPQASPTRGVAVESSVAMQEEMEEEEEDEIVVQERRNLARRLVFKCIRAACYKMMNDGRRDSIEYLIASTKRMRISSPSPTHGEDLLPSPPPPSPQLTKTSKTTRTRSSPSHATMREEEEERCLTPESQRRQKLRKKRGRSESHEVTSLVDYDIVKRHLIKVSAERKAGQFGGGVVPEKRTTSRGRDEDLGGLANTLGMMTIDEDFNSSEEEPELQSLTEDSHRDIPIHASNAGGTAPFLGPSPLITTHTDGFTFSSKLPEVVSMTTISNVSITFDSTSMPSMLFSHEATPTYTDPPSMVISNETTPIHDSMVISNETTPSHITSEPSMVVSSETTPSHINSEPSIMVVSSETTPNHHDMATPTVQETTPLPLGGESIIPGMDMYIHVHSCPPRGECQKFLCHNTNEINLVHHCWLFGGVACDPTLTISDKLKVGVFTPTRVLPVHQDLQDSGAPFYYMEERSICIHSCCFSPDNSQLQLQDVPSSTTSSSSPYPDFHSFYSAGRHGERRVVCLHLLPCSPSVEGSLRESVDDCSTLNQLLLQLNSTVPDVGSKIWDLVSTL